MKEMLVWDLPTRWFHWALVCLVMVCHFLPRMNGEKGFYFALNSMIIKPTLTIFTKVRPFGRKDGTLFHFNVDLRIYQ